MENFTLEEYLKTPDRAVVTRDGKTVKIVCASGPNTENPVIGYIFYNNAWCGPFDWHSDGTYKIYKDEWDLFFAGREDELSELEQTLKEDMDYYVFLKSKNTPEAELIEWIRIWKWRIIELAKKDDTYPCDGSQEKSYSDPESKPETKKNGISGSGNTACPTDSRKNEKSGPCDSCYGKESPEICVNISGSGKCLAQYI